MCIIYINHSTTPHPVPSSSPVSGSTLPLAQYAVTSRNEFLLSWNGVYTHLLTSMCIIFSFLLVKFNFYYFPLVCFNRYWCWFFCLCNIFWNFINRNYKSYALPKYFVLVGFCSVWIMAVSRPRTCACM